MYVESGIPLYSLNNNDLVWYFTHNAHEADLSIQYVNVKAFADVTVYLETSNRFSAKWNNPTKVHLLHTKGRTRMNHLNHLSLHQHHYNGAATAASPTGAPIQQQQQQPTTNQTTTNNDSVMVHDNADDGDLRDESDVASLSSTRSINNNSSSIQHYLGRANVVYINPIDDDDDDSDDDGNNGLKDGRSNGYYREQSPVRASSPVHVGAPAHSFHNGSPSLSSSSSSVSNSQHSSSSSSSSQSSLRSSSSSSSYYSSNSSSSPIDSVASFMSVSDDGGETSVVHGQDQKKRFEILEQIGKGGMGTVYKARDVKRDRLVAIKKIHCLSVKEMNSAIKELLPIKGMATHPNIALLDDVYFEQHVSRDDDGHRAHHHHQQFTMCFVLELFEGDLFQRLQARKDTNAYYSESEVRNMFEQLASGLAHIHKYQIVHNDLKPMNIFVQGDTLKIGDFGLSRNLENLSTTISGTQKYMSPDRFVNSQTYTLKSDIWSLGVCFYELLCLEVKGVPFFEVYRNKNFYQDIEHLLGNELGYSRQLIDIVTRCMALEPDERPSIDQVLGMIRAGQQ